MEWSTCELEPGQISLFDNFGVHHSCPTETLRYDDDGVLYALDCWGDKVLKRGGRVNLWIPIFEVWAGGTSEEVTAEISRVEWELKKKLEMYVANKGVLRKLMMAVCIPLTYLEKISEGYLRFGLGAFVKGKQMSYEKVV